jgi:16S rRNA G966 N2-methylase RsmD
MSQKYKAVYFPDLSNDNSKQKSLTLAFGTKTNELFKSIKDLSSEEIRQLIGTDSFENIVNAAKVEELPLNSYCVRQIKRSLKLFEDKNKQLSFPSIPNYESIFDPISVTFKGGSQEPFIRWYPLLQGYSPQFVETILNKYSPYAEVVLDPFAGTGTTAFTAAQLNKKAYFCEINPVLQFICLTKIKVRKLKTPERLKLYEALIESRESLEHIGQFERENRLDDSYRKCFDNSEFFAEETYEQVLRTRTWVDKIALEKPLLADLITVAVLAALVPASKMKRVGDLRYKTANENRRQTKSLIQEVYEGIGQIAQDIYQDVNGIQTEPILIAENAKSLVNIPKLNIDTIITSPPYVNGTNYFRNTKIELWFLRCLNDKSDLARYRLQSLTAGINDVTMAKIKEIKNPEVREIVTVLQNNAYDQRIPHMVGNYFNEISEVFNYICKHLTDKATVAIDIGDSCYGGIHVPVDRLLSSCLKEFGFIEKDVTELRQRRSKSGAILKQLLMVYEYYPIKAQSCEICKLPDWKSSWEVFKATIPHQKLPYAKRNWGHSLHSLCSYEGKMKPAIAHFLVQTFVPDKGKVLDPFAGVGTIPFEGALQGKTSYGFEISPAAFVISKGKTQCHNRDRCNEIIRNLDLFIKNNRPTNQELEEASRFGFNGKLTEFYHPDTLNEIILARRFFNNKQLEQPEEFFVMASLLHVLHGNRPYALSRRSHPITPYKPTGPTEYRSLIVHLKEKVERGLEDQMPSDFKPSRIFFQDATNWWPKEITDLDAVITSPPFFDSTRFYLANWIRLWFCGWNRHDFEVRPLGFIEERQKVDFDVYVPLLRQARERLKPDGVVVLHLGKSKKCDMAKQLTELGRNWFHSAELFEEDVSHCESHGIRDKGTVVIHQYLVLY